jgi:hypothetical protein
MATLPGPSLTYKRAKTGRQTALDRKGRWTTIPAVTKQLPRLVFLPPGAEPSYCQNAPCTCLPLRRVTLSSIATTIGAPASTSVAMTSRAATMPTWSMHQQTREKKRCARSCRHSRFMPAPTSIPVIVRNRVQATKPVVSAQNTGKVEEEKQRRNSASSQRQLAGRVGSGNIGGHPLRRRCGKGPPMFPHVRAQSGANDQFMASA